MTRHREVSAPLRTGPATARPARRTSGVGLLGPAFVAAIAYVDPGNVAANLTAGAEYGYLLLWVLVAANVMAMLVQYLSAKVGLVTGQSLPELLGAGCGSGPVVSIGCRPNSLPRPPTSPR